MVLNTITVGAAVTPAVIKTCTSHVWNPPPLTQDTRSKLTITVPRSQASETKTHRAHLLRRRSEPDPLIPPFCLLTYRRRDPSLYVTMGSHPTMGQSRRTHHPTEIDQGRSRRHHRAARSQRRRPCGRQYLVAMEERRDPAESRVDRDEKGLSTKKTPGRSGNESHVVRAWRSILLW